jgi:hypothetical protein
MRFLRTNTAVIVTVGPFYDKTDGVTIEGSLTITNERITLTADTDAGSAPTLILDNVTGATAGTSNDLNYITNNDAGLMQLELTAADTNRLGRMFLTITDAANHVPVFHEFMVLPAMIYDAFILGTDVLDASMTQILGTAVSAPATAGILDVNVKNIDNDAASASGTVTFPNATLASTTGAVGSVTGAVGSVTGAVGSVTGAVGSIGAGGISAASFAANAITAAKLDPDVTTELQAGLDTSSAVSTLQTSVDDIPTSAELATALGTADDAVLTQIALVKAKTDSLTFTVANKVDANTKSINDVTVTGVGTTGDPWGP